VERPGRWGYYHHEIVFVSRVHGGAVEISSPEGLGTDRKLALHARVVTHIPFGQYDTGLCFVV
jgi:hypothetical protein